MIKTVFLFIFCGLLWLKSLGFGNSPSERHRDSIVAQVASDKAWKLKDINTDSSTHYARISLEIAKKWGFLKLESYALSDMAFAFLHQGRTDSARTYWHKSLAIRQSRNDTSDIVNCYLNLGLLYNECQKYDSAIFFLQKGLHLASSIPTTKTLGSICNSLSISHSNQGKYQAAEEYLLRAMDVAEVVGDSIGLGYRFQSMGVLNIRLNRYSTALDYLSKARRLFEKFNKTLGLIDILSNEGAIYLSQGSLGQSIQKFQQARELSEKEGFQATELTALTNLGLAYNYLKKHGLAEDALEKASELAKKQGKEKSFVEVTINYGYVKLAQKKYKEAQQLLPNLKNAIVRVNIPRFLAEYYQLESKVYSNMGDYRKALASQLRYARIQDSLSSLVDQAQASLAQMEQDKRDKIILESENTLQAAELERRIMQNQNQWLGIIILALFLIMIVIVTSLKLRNAKEKNKALAEKKKSDEKLQNVLREVDRQILEKEIETNKSTSFKIGQDLHDNLGNKLALVQMSIDGIRKKLEHIPMAVSNRFDKVEALMEESCEDLRSIAHNLQDNELQYQDIIKEIELYTGLINEAGGMKVGFRQNGYPESMREQSKKEIASIVRLLIENVLRHSKANEVTIDFAVINDVFTIEIQDDGMGFDKAGGQKSGGRGLANAQMRVQELGGEFAVDSTPGKGTTALINLPIRNL